MSRRERVAAALACVGIVVAGEQLGQPAVNGGFFVAGLGLVIVAFLLALPSQHDGPSTQDELAARRARREQRRAEREEGEGA